MGYYLIDDDVSTVNVIQRRHEIVLRKVPYTLPIQYLSSYYYTSMYLKSRHIIILTYISISKSIYIYNTYLSAVAPGKSLSFLMFNLEYIKALLVTRAHTSIIINNINSKSTSNKRSFLTSSMSQKEDQHISIYTGLSILLVGSFIRVKSRGGAYGLYLVKSISYDANESNADTVNNISIECFGKKEPVVGTILSLSNDLPSQASYYHTHIIINAHHHCE